MTYNPDEWEVGDIARITVTHSIRSSSDPLVVVRMLAEWPTPRGRFWHGPTGRMPWRDRRIVEAERLFPVDHATLQQINDRPADPAYPQQATSWTAASGALIGSNVHITTAPPPARIDLNCGSPGCSTPGCVFCGNP